MKPMERTLVYTAEVRLLDADLSTVLCDMRTWLDHHRCEPEGFRHCTGGGEVRFLVDFKAESEAQAFAKAFGGRLSGAPQQAELP
jgi:hypothetical protein